MECCQQTCNEPATWRVFWPGQPPRPMCDSHEDKARAIGEAMGFYVYAEPLTAAEAAR